MKRPRDQQIHRQVYRNTIMANTWGYAYNTIKASVGFGQVMTPLALVPANNLALYTYVTVRI
jgi:hypothetical protein